MSLSDNVPHWCKQRLHDLQTAFGLLTRLPIPRFGHDLNAPISGATSAWAWPLVGAFLGVLAYGVAQGAHALGMPPLISALFSVAALVIATGAFHEDGLADSADGLWGGYAPERRLEIMKDSHIGSYGVLALILIITLRVMALGEIVQNPFIFMALVAIGAMSRLPMVVFMVLMPAANKGGLSTSVGRPSGRVAVLAHLLGLALAFWCLGLQALWLGLCISAVTALWALIAWRKIGGQTGDILGASQQLAEVAGLLTLVFLWA
ncbi:MAG: adenosylcobinamide-GDP ribazoletransferase [Paracoccaceae bacterium]